ncbi:pyridine nucleotide-disulfide oxidoreductase [Pontibacillus chungwhensis BH030062]|uniref:Pyridine nucleotide-disulfide oxidoreductase n=1 Tax=Pontibacillus chungwhensis BH030062 TaxID=1385513 RepID=A0A0A2VHE2_9BACI|nr:FAD-dependent oxidoreductase [Pontibacillus chungwhensis]KGP93040.1 pyridine nucleotide-disulfide oxidoreductase [Pontibacillus chungwhensis BH030062]
MNRLVLIGAGHAHLHIIDQLRNEQLPDTEVILISPSPYQYYSGMFSGYAEGLYNEEDIRVSLPQLCEKASVDFKEEFIVSIDAEQKILLTDQGNVLSYDVVSFDIGSLTAHTDIKGVKEHARRIKPNYHFPAMVDEVRQTDHLSIVGGGIAGVELALSLQSYRTHHNEGKDITIVSGTERLLPGETEDISKKIERIVKGKGIKLQKGSHVTEMTNDKIYTDQGTEIKYTDALWLAGPKAPGVFKQSKLPIDDGGYLQVESTLQVKDHPSIFGAGDCISLSENPDLPKNGVFAIRQAPILWENIKGFLSTGDGSHYIPQHKWLAIMSIGHKEGFLLYGKWSYKGKIAWSLKNRIDRKFMNQYQT